MPWVTVLTMVGFYRSSFPSANIKGAVSHKRLFAKYEVRLA